MTLWMVSLYAFPRLNIDQNQTLRSQNEGRRAIPSGPGLHNIPCRNDNHLAALYLLTSLQPPGYSAARARKRRVRSGSIGLSRDLDFNAAFEVAPV